MRGQRLGWRSCLRVWTAWLIMATPGICSSFSGVVLTDGGRPVSGATVSWNNEGVCVPTPPHGTPRCYPSTVAGVTRTGSDGSFACAQSPRGHVHRLCESPRRASTSFLVRMGGPRQRPGKNQADGKRGPGLACESSCKAQSLVVITVDDPTNALSTSFFLPGVVVGTGGYFRANYDSNRRAYTRLIAKGITARLFFDTLLVVQDVEGNSLPIDTAVLPFVTGADEAALSVSVVPALVNAASYIPGVTEGTIATLFGSGFTDTPGIHIAPGFPLPTQLSGVSVKVNGIAAPLLAVVEQEGRAQINFQIPHFSTYNQQLVIVVENNGKERTFYVRNWAEQLGIFGSLAHVNGDAITETNAARPGEQITIYWTGMSGYNFVYSTTVFYIPDGIPSPPSVPCVSYFRSAGADRGHQSRRTLM